MIADHTSQAPPPLSPVVAAVLAHEKLIDPQPEIVRARALARARKSLREANALVNAPSRFASPARRLIYAAAAAVILMASAAAAYQMLRRPEAASPVGMSRPSPEHHAQVVPGPEQPAPQLGREELARTAVTVSRAPVPSRRPIPVNKSQARSEELRLLVRARQAEARGEYASVLSILAEHEHLFPTGRLSEEREVLRLKALVGLGRAGEARQVGASFRHHYPRSVLLHRVEEMLASLG